MLWNGYTTVPLYKSKGARCNPLATVHCLHLIRKLQLGLGRGIQTALHQAQIRIQLLFTLYILTLSLLEFDPVALTLEFGVALSCISLAGVGLTGAFPRVASVS
jgi:hypothetical protein